MYRETFYPPHNSELGRDIIIGSRNIRIICTETSSPPLSCADTRQLNASYDIVHKVTAANDKFADLHELIITPDGTALMIVFEVVPADVRSLGRKFNDVWNQAIWDCLVQEVHIATGELRFEWRASEHLNISRTYMKLDSMAEGTQENPFDPYHLNSVEKDALGNYLISARNPHAIYYVDGRTGETIWTLGGMDNSFMELNDGPMQALNFAWQHDVRFVPTDAFPETYIPPPDREGTTVILLTMFDNAAVDWDYSYGTPYSRGLLLELTYPTPGFYTGKKMTRVEFTAARIDDRGSREPQESLSKLDAAKVASINGKSASHTVRLVREFINPKHVRSGTQGSVQLIPQGPGLDPKALVGYGLNAVITEYNSNGSVLCDLHFGAESSWERGDVQSYRAHKSHWVGRPKTGPVAATQGNEIFVSWNGATEVRSWLLQALDSVEEGWVEVSRTRKQGFETTIHLPEEYRAARHLRLFALDSEGRLCEHGISNVISRNAFGIALRQHMNGSGLPTFTSFVYLVCSAFGIAALYRLLLRYLSWRRGRTRFGQTSRRRGQA